MREKTNRIALYIKKNRLDACRWSASLVLCCESSPQVWSTTELIRTISIKYHIFPRKRKKDYCEYRKNQKNARGANGIGNRISFSYRNCHVFAIKYDLLDVTLVFLLSLFILLV